MVTRKSTENKSLKQIGLDKLEKEFEAGKNHSKAAAKKEELKNKEMAMESRRHTAEELGVKPSTLELEDYERTTWDKIYDDKTLQTYKASWVDFCNFLKEYGIKVNGHSPRTFEEARQCVNQYIEALKEKPGKSEGTKMSPWTIRTRFQGVAKVLDIHAEDYDLPARKIEDITRSRGEKESDKHFSEDKNAELVAFCKSTGLRNYKELQRIKNDCLVNEDGTPWINGSGLKPFIHVKGKGGLYRNAPIIGSEEEIKIVVDKIQGTADGLAVWPRVPKNADVHGYRREYAKRIYSMYARPVDELDAKKKFTIKIYNNAGKLIRSYERSKKYVCHDGTKTVFDAKALYEVSKALGHNRVDVSAYHYVDRGFNCIAEAKDDLKE